MTPTPAEIVRNRVAAFERSAPDPNYKAAFALGALTNLAAEWLEELELIRAERDRMRAELLRLRDIVSDEDAGSIDGLL